MKIKARRKSHEEEEGSNKGKKKKDHNTQKRITQTQATTYTPRGGQSSHFLATMKSFVITSKKKHTHTQQKVLKARHLGQSHKMGALHKTQPTHPQTCMSHMCVQNLKVHETLQHPCISIF